MASSDSSQNKPDVATFQVKPAGAGLFDLGSVALSCEVDFDRERKQWRAWDEQGHEAWSEWKPLAAARLFVARMEAAMEPGDDY